MKYIALLVTSDGKDYVTDFKGKTIEEVEEMLSNRGSVWFFYPLEFIITTNGDWRNFLRKRVIRAYGVFKQFEGKSIKTLLEFIKNNPDLIKEVLK